MQVKEVKNEGLKRQFEIVLPAKDINKRVDERISELSKTIKIPGFRPGKVPLSVVKKKYGKEVMGQVLEKAISDTSDKVISEKKLTPALQPKIEIDSYDDGKDLKFGISLEVYPEVPEVSFDKITVDEPVLKLSSKDFDDSIKRLRESNKDFSPLKKARAAKEGDVVVIDFLGSVDGVAFDGGKGEGYNLELGSKTFIPGFEDQLVKSKKGDKKTVKVKFPDNYGAPHLAGKDAEFEVTVHDILESSVPELNDEFAKKFGFENVDKLKEAIENQIKKDFESIKRIKIKKDLFDKMNAACKMEIPEGMFDLEYASVLDSLGIKKDAKIEKKQEKEYKDIAERRVKLGILLAEIGKNNKVEVREDDLRKAVFEEARRYPGQEQRIIEIYQKNHDALDRLRGTLLEDKVVDFVLGKVKKKEKEVGMADLLKEVESE